MISTSRKGAQPGTMPVHIERPIDVLNMKAAGLASQEKKKTCEHARRTPSCQYHFMFRFSWMTTIERNTPFVCIIVVFVVFLTLFVRGSIVYFIMSGCMNSEPPRSSIRCGILQGHLFSTMSGSIAARTVRVPALKVSNRKPHGATQCFGAIN